MLSFLLKVLGVVFVIVIAAHAYMYFQYETFDACEAATNKVVGAISSQNTVEGAATTAIEQGAGLVEERAENGILGCYKTVFIGGE